MAALVAIRRAKNIRRRTVAKHIGVSTQRVRFLERPDSDPHLTTVHQYALAIGATINHDVTADGSER